MIACGRVKSRSGIVAYIVVSVVLDRVVHVLLKKENIHLLVLNSVVLVLLGIAKRGKHTLVSVE